MNERNWSQARQWSSGAYARARDDSRELDLLMRSILKLFAEGCLKYHSPGRARESKPVLTQTDRLKRVRRDLAGVL